jgi:hypothetical protein
VNAFFGFAMISDIPLPWQQSSLAKLELESQTEFQLLDSYLILPSVFNACQDDVGNRQ